MPKYRILCQKVQQYYIDVEAENLDEAVQYYDKCPETELLAEGDAEWELLDTEELGKEEEDDARFQGHVRRVQRLHSDGGEQGGSGAVGEESAG